MIGWVKVVVLLLALLGLTSLPYVGGLFVGLLIGNYTAQTALKREWVLKRRPIEPPRCRPVGDGARCDCDCDCAAVKV